MRKPHPCLLRITSWMRWRGQSRKFTWVPLSTLWPGSHFPLDCIWNSSICRAVAMGMAGRGIRIQEVLKGAPLLSLWTLVLLFLSMWELDAQTAVETRPMYIWRTGTVHPLCSFSPGPWDTEWLDGCSNLALLMKYSYANVCVHNTIHKGKWKGWTCLFCFFHFLWLDQYIL